MAKLWAGRFEGSANSLLDEFNASLPFDRNLYKEDIQGSIEHAKMLHSIGVLRKDELDSLINELRSIEQSIEEGKFSFDISHEDIHMAIESALSQKLGDVGKRLHSARSRNDQVALDFKLYCRKQNLALRDSLKALISTLLDLADNHTQTLMPGMTHLQHAQPISFGYHLVAWCLPLKRDIQRLRYMYEESSDCPLGSAASYGVPIPLDREYTASLLGFKGPQHNVLYANNSRGRFESMLLDVAGYLCATAAKMAQDLILFTLPELGYFSLPVELTTGSSIMPQKKNPDGLELVRSRAARVASSSMLVKDITRCLVSGYNRDFQDTKEPLLDGMRTAYDVIAVMARMLSGLVVHEDRLRQGMRKEIYATDKVFDSVAHGGNFRDSYKAVGLDLDSVEEGDADAALKRRTSTGTSGNLGLDDDYALLGQLTGLVTQRLARLQEVYDALVPSGHHAVGLAD